MKDQVSATDVMLIKKLANPTALNLHDLPSDTEDIPIHETIYRDPIDLPDTDSVTDNNDNSIQKKRHLQHEQRKDHKKKRKTDGSKFGLPGPRENHKNPSPPISPNIFEVINSPDIPSSKKEKPAGLPEWRPDEVYKTNTLFSDIFDESRQNESECTAEKQILIQELLKFEKQGFTCSRKFTEQDDLSSIQLEFDRLSTFRDQVSYVNMMKEGLKLLLSGVEMVNKKGGPFLKLDGWSTSVTTDMSKYDVPLGKIYLRYFRRSSMHPVAEIAYMLGTSAVSHHFTNQLFGGPVSSTPNPMFTKTVDEKDQFEKEYSGRRKMAPP